jgi:hypothetical protein
MATATDPYRGARYETAAPAGTMPWRRISWGAALAGVAIAIAVQLVLTMIGLGIGLSTIDVSAGAGAGAPGVPSGSSLGIGSGVWWVVTSLIATLVGAFVAARLAGVPVRLDGVIHGLLTWALTLIVTVYLLTTAAGGLLGGAYHLVGNAVSAAGQGISKAAPELARQAGMSTGDLQSQVEALLKPQNEQPGPDQAKQQLMGDLKSIAMGEGNVDEARKQAVTVIAQQAGISQEQAQQRLQQFEQKATDAKNQAVQTAKETADKTASAISTGSLWSAAALILGAIVAIIGGLLGTPSLSSLRESTRL